MSVPLDQTKFYVTCDIFDGKAVVSEGSFAGNNYYVVPSVMLVEGAFTPAIDSLSEPTSLYFDGSDIMNSTHSWNGRPVSLYHPIGDNSCNVPHILDNQLIGYVFNARFEEVEKKLRADLWLLRGRGKFIIDKIMSGEKIDLSVGAFGDIVPEEGISNVVVYSQRMTNIVGAHLAVLPGARGACSWTDGCGIRMEEKSVVMAETRMVSRRPSYSGVEKTLWNADTNTLSAYLSAYYEQSEATKPDDLPVEVKDMPLSIKRWIASKTLLGNPMASGLDDIMFFPVVSSLTNKLNEGALRAVLSEIDSQANISDGAKSSAHSMAERLLNSEFGKKETKMEEKVVKVEVPCEKKAEKAVTMSDVLANAPDDLKVVLEDAMRERDEQRNSLVSAIDAYDKLSFCPNFLASTDTKELKTIAALVEAATQEKVVVSNVDYSLKSGMEVSDKKRCSAPSLF